jgi:hypothetical protein
VLPKAIHHLRGVLCCALALAVSANASVIVQLRVVDGEGATYRTGTRATHGVTVLVTDDAGKPIEGASVSFRLPDQGATGTFNSGLRTEVVTTGADGRASVWGMQWNKTAGPMQIRITAVKDQACAGIVSTQYLSDADTTPTSGGQGDFKASHSHKWLWIAGIAAGAAAGGVFAMSHSKSPADTANPSAAALSIGTPSITIGHP